MIIIRELIIRAWTENLRKAFWHGVAMEVATVVSMFTKPLVEVMAYFNRKFRQARRPSTGFHTQCRFRVIIVA
jgi:hypothetical protein